MLLQSLCHHHCLFLEVLPSQAAQKDQLLTVFIGVNVRLLECKMRHACGSFLFAAVCIAPCQSSQVSPFLLLVRCHGSQHVSHMALAAFLGPVVPALGLLAAPSSAGLSLCWTCLHLQPDTWIKTADPDYLSQHACLTFSKACIVWCKYMLNM